MNLTPQEKYQHKPFIGSSHSWALAQCSQLPSSIRVLDVGPGSGIMGEALKQKGVTSLAAVEIDEDARKHIAGIYSQIEESLEPLLDQTFDLILLLDVMEHMANPFEFFQTASQLLTPGGTILISLPNIAHWSVRLPLLFGQFNYTNRGILDRTHLQFFTRARLIELLQVAPGFITRQITGSIAPAEFVLPEALCKNPIWKLLSQIRMFGADTVPGLCAYQLLARVERPKSNGEVA
jgi:2-polyprenyl-3-methyl-5-hydroxy-6-metoxy-1,4-benzoquinol methylase